MKEKPKVRKLAIRLLKDEFSPDTALIDDHGLEEQPWPSRPRGKLFTGRTRFRSPKWVEFLKEGTGEEFNLNVRSASAVLFVPVESRWVVLTFGGGLYALKQESYEMGFGLRCVLNSIRPDSLKSLDVSTPEQTTVQRRIQASRESELEVFNITTDRDILKKIQGKATDSEFAKSMTGSDALTMSAPLFAKDLAQKCEQILNMYAQRTYKARFGWVDYVANVRDKKTVEDLNALLLEDLESCEGIAHLAAPEIVDPEVIGEYKYRGTRNDVTFSTLSLDDYLASIHQDTLSIESLKRHKVVLVQDDNTELPRWSIFNSLVFETQLDKGLYVLSSGSWYRVDKSFANEVNAAFESIPSGPELPDVDVSVTEDAYIDSLTKGKPDWACLHTKNIQCNRWSSGVEPCDFLTPDRQFIHIKNKAESSTLSHLFNQGVVSAEAFVRESEFRKKLNEHINTVHPAFQSPCADHEKSVPREGCKVVFAVMREPYKRTGEMGLPFFSKVALRNAKQRLDGFGLQTQFSWVRKVSAA